MAEQTADRLRSLWIRAAISACHSFDRTLTLAHNVPDRGNAIPNVNNVLQGYDFRCSLRFFAHCHNNQMSCRDRSECNSPDAMRNHMSKGHAYVAASKASRNCRTEPRMQLSQSKRFKRPTSRCDALCGGYDWSQEDRRRFLKNNSGFQVLSSMNCLAAVQITSHATKVSEALKRVRPRENF